jgi:hypothetical protein
MERIRIKLADNVSSGQHTLRLTVSSEMNETSSGSLCVVDAFEVKAAPPPTFPVLPVALLGVGMTLISFSLYREIARNAWRHR